MAEAHRREAWNHTAQLLALIYNAHGDPKSHTRCPEEFHPLVEKKPPIAKVKDLSILRQVFVEK